MIVILFTRPLPKGEDDPFYALRNASRRLIWITDDQKNVNCSDLAAGVPPHGRRAQALLYKSGYDRTSPVSGATIPRPRQGYAECYLEVDHANAELKIRNLAIEVPRLETLPEMFHAVHPSVEETLPRGLLKKPQIGIVAEVSG